MIQLAKDGKADEAAGIDAGRGGPKLSRELSRISIETMVDLEDRIRQADRRAKQCRLPKRPTSVMSILAISA
jgi:hypothetical protein